MHSTWWKKKVTIIKHVQTTDFRTASGFFRVQRNKASRAVATSRRLCALTPGGGGSGFENIYIIVIYECTLACVRLVTRFDRPRKSDRKTRRDGVLKMSRPVAAEFKLENRRGSRRVVASKSNPRFQRVSRTALHIGPTVGRVQPSGTFLQFYYRFLRVVFYDNYEIQ